MEHLVDLIVEDIVVNFNFVYIITVNILTFIIIKVIDYFNGDNIVNTIQKRACLVGSIIICGLIYYYTNNITIVNLVNSAVAAPVVWSWFLRPIFIKLGLGYKQIDDCLN